MDKFCRRIISATIIRRGILYFCNTVLVAYAKAFGDVVTYKEKVIEAEEEKKVDNAIKDEVAPYISKMTHIVEGIRLYQTQKDEIISLLDGLYYSLTPKEQDLSEQCG